MKVSTLVASFTYYIFTYYNCRQTSNMRHTLVGNKSVDHADVIGPCLSALLQLHLHSGLYTWLQWIGHRQLQNEMRIIKVLGFGAPYIRGLMIVASTPGKHHHISYNILYIWLPLVTAICMCGWYDAAEYQLTVIKTANESTQWSLG